jgi:hypothetical protein
MKYFLWLSALVVAGTLQACNSSNEKSESAETSKTATAVEPATVNFSADSAYRFVATQVGFGPRTPGSAAQKACAAWMEGMLRASCDTVYRQEAQVKGGDGKMLPCINLIGAINPQAQRRILLLAHWDSRPWADQDTKDMDKPIDAADDGGSGVAVLLEIARQLKATPLPQGLGVDILLTDVEDYGKSEWGDASYGLGTQYWARNPHVPGYKAEGGILLDMVGAAGARFPMEASSREYAYDLQQSIWQTANRAGYSSYFSFDVTPGAITDDHTFVNQIAHIPTVDIIHLTQNTETSFPAHWHTHADAMPVIDRATLEAVGKTLLQFLRERAQAV